ncbi:mycofactocin-coupled SDR family oxidoreductase [Streptomyces sp. NBC_00258]|uniref:mycofactocin-coupled SDR family oxidoreductase n=1 Tax=Streptomyces sp. NBC_00258 TaxID=2903642 RepID=UPI002E2C2C6D|nr:mycofactocin-coupled SDR family oxidoreductase [Streptomyces sp. NBC_00258]
MARLEGKVAFVTGAARGIGHACAVRLAEEGADIIAVDLGRQVASVSSEMTTPGGLSETVAAVEGLGRRIVASMADVRDFEAVKDALETGMAELGRLDIVCPNAGIASHVAVADMPLQTWRDVIDINLTGVFHTCKAAIPHLADGGSIVITSSVVGLKGGSHITHYSASKHAVVGFMRSLAHELAERMIRVNTVHPTTVNTPMLHEDEMMRLFVPGVEHPTLEQFAEASKAFQLLPVPWIEPQDVANAVAFLASDEARYITGVTLPVDAGTLAL